MVASSNSGDITICPRCNSPDTKFCYHNNKKVSQPRYKCNDCKRKFTKGGKIRFVPLKDKNSHVKSNVPGKKRPRDPVVNFNKFKRRPRLKKQKAVCFRIREAAERREDALLTSSETDEDDDISFDEESDDAEDDDDDEEEVEMMIKETSKKSTLKRKKRGGGGGGGGGDADNVSSTEDEYQHKHQHKKKPALLKLKHKHSSSKQIHHSKTTRIPAPPRKTPNAEDFVTQDLSVRKSNMIGAFEKIKKAIQDGCAGITYS